MTQTLPKHSRALPPANRVLVLDVPGAPVTLVAGAGVTLTVNGNTVTLAASGGGGGGTVTVEDPVSGDGSADSPLGVKVDGETIGVNGSGELESLVEGGGATPGGSTKDVQLNDGAGGLAGSDALKFDATAQVLTLRNLLGALGFPTLLFDANVMGQGLGAQIEFDVPVTKDANILWHVNGNNAFLLGINAGQQANFFLYSSLTSKFIFQYGGAAGSENVLRTEGAFAPAGGYKAADDTPGVTAGPFTTITSIEVKNGLVVGLTGS